MLIKSLIKRFIKPLIKKLIKGVKPIVTILPTDVDDLIGWYDSDDASTITESAGVVSKQDDKSTENNDLIENTVSQRPTTNLNTMNDRNVISYDRPDDQTLQKQNMVVPVNLTVFIVAKVTDTTASGDSILSMANTGGEFEIRSSTDIDDRFFAQIISVGLGATSPPIHSSDLFGLDTLFTVRFSDNDSDVNLRINSAPSDSDTYNGGLQTPLDLKICENRSGVRHAGADVAEVLIYGRDLTSTEIDNLEFYLSDKWGL